MASLSFARIAVVGAGAVGCFFGGMLARAGHRVMLIGRQAHVDAMRASGLRLETRKFDERVAVQASTSAESVRDADLVLFCVKSMATEDAASEIAPFLARHAIVLNLQNGVDNAERIQARIEQPVVPAVVYVATEMAGPGHVKHHGRGDLVVGTLDARLPSGALEAIQALFASSGVPVALSQNVRGELWAKLVVNCAYNALSAITQLPYGELVRGAGIREVMGDVVEEALAVAKTSGVRMAEDMIARTYAIAEAMPAQYSSTAQDLARGKPTEIDHLNGYLVRRGEAIGVPTPVNRVLHALVLLLERKASGGGAMLPPN
jgi:2-dehydropantoate 2-reductase